jgi:predicted component of type VI protein secretion system
MNMHTYRLKGASGQVANRSFGLGARTVIGRAADCDLQVEDPSVAPRHAEITLLDNGEVLLAQLDPAFEIRVNGQPVDRASLASGDEIRMGSCRWVVQAPGLRPEKVLTPEALRPQRAWLPWLIVAALLAAAALAWQRGWLPF